MRVFRVLLLLALFMSGVLSLRVRADERLAPKAVWSPDGDMIAFTDRKDLIVYDEGLVEQQRIPLIGPDEEMTDLALVWSPLQDKIAMHAIGVFGNAVESVVRIWDVKTGAQIGQIDDLPFYVNPESPDVFYFNTAHIAWLPDNEHLSVIQSGETEGKDQLEIYTLEGDLIDTLTSREDFTGQDWSTDGTFVVTSSTAGFPIDVWDTKTKELVFFTGPLGYDVDASILLSDDNHYAAAIAQYGMLIEVWDVIEDKLDPEFAYRISVPEGFKFATVSHLVFGWHDDHSLWSVGNDEFMHIWRFKTPDVIASYPIDIAHLYAISPDGSKALYGEGHEIRIEEIETGTVVAEVTFSEEAVFPEQWTPLSSYLEPSNG